MPLSAFAVVLASAVLHAGWNVILARSRDIGAATTVALALSVVLFAPVAALKWDVDGAAIPWIAVSATLELLYFTLLTAAYSHSDLTLIYPIARGSAPVLVLVLAGLTGVVLGTWQAFGVVLVGLGVVLVRGLGAEIDRHGVLLALGIGATIAAYTLVDKEGIEHASTIAYFELVLLPVGIAAVSWRIARGRGMALRSEVSAATAALRSGPLARTRSYWSASHLLRHPRSRRCARRASSSLLLSGRLCWGSRSAGSALPVRYSS